MTLIVQNRSIQTIATIIILLTCRLSDAQEKIIFESKHLKCNDTVLVFTPSGSNRANLSRYPALFLLHGWSGNYKDWSTKTKIQEVSDKWGFVIITPDGFYNSWYLNNVNNEKMQWRDFFNNELYPGIMSRFGLDSDKTFITGLSMGGHGAINIFIDDTTRFRAAGSMSGVLNLHDTRLKETQLPEVLGPYVPENTLYSKSSAIGRISSLKGMKKMLVISCGAQDLLVKSSRDFVEECEKYNIANTLIIRPGAHSWPYWIEELDLHLYLFTRIIK